MWLLFWFFNIFSKTLYTKLFTLKSDDLFNQKTCFVKEAKLRLNFKATSSFDIVLIMQLKIKPSEK